MSVESAEMTKHALNAFLATSIAFTNELATLCEYLGADAKEVERGLKSDARVGPGAYISPGSAFAGGALARDVTFLAQIDKQVQVPTHLLTAVRISNNEHKTWSCRKLKQLLGEISGRAVAVLGLTYKPGTDTLRRSSSLEMCIQLAQQGAQVRAYDPVVAQLPDELNRYLTLCSTAHETLQRADALILATEWPVFRTLSVDDILGEMRTPIVIDPNRFLETTLASDGRLQYVAVGMARGIE